MSCVWSASESTGPPAGALQMLAMTCVRGTLGINSEMFLESKINSDEETEAHQWDVTCCNSYKFNHHLTDMSQAFDHCNSHVVSLY